MTETLSQNYEAENLARLSLSVERLDPQPGLKAQLLTALQTADQVARGEKPAALTPIWDFTIALADGKAALTEEEELLRSYVGESLLTHVAAARPLSDERFYYKRILRSMGAEVDDPEERYLLQQPQLRPTAPEAKTDRSAQPAKAQTPNVTALPVRSKAEVPDLPAISWPKRIAATAVATAVISGVALEAASAAAAAPAPATPHNVSMVLPATTKAPETSKPATPTGSSNTPKNGTPTAASKPLPVPLQKKPPETIVPLPLAPATPGPEKAKTQPYIPGKSPSNSIVPLDGASSGSGESTIVVTPGSGPGTPNQSGTSAANPDTPIAVAPGNPVETAPATPDTTVPVQSSATLPNPSPANQTPTPPSESASAQTSDPNTIVVSSAPVASSGGQNIQVTPGNTPPAPPNGSANEMAPRTTTPIQLANTPGAVVTVPSTATPTSPGTLVPLPAAATTPTQTDQETIAFLMQNGGSSLQVAQAEETQLENKYGFIPAPDSAYRQAVIADAQQSDSQNGGQADINNVKAIILADMPAAAAAPEITSDTPATTTPFVSILSSQVYGDTQSGLAGQAGQENYNQTTQGAIDTYLAQGVADHATPDEQNAILSQLSGSTVAVTPPPAPTPAPAPAPAPPKAPAQPGSSHGAPKPPETLSPRQLAIKAAQSMAQQGGLAGRQGQVTLFFLQNTDWSVNGILGGPVGNGTEESEGLNPMRSQATQTDVPASDVLSQGLAGGWGLWQSDPPTKVIQWCEAHGLDPNTIEGQGAWLINAVNGMPELKAQLERGDISVEAAAVAFEQIFERAGNPALSVRKADARQAANVFHGHFSKVNQQYIAAQKKYQHDKAAYDHAQKLKANQQNSINSIHAKLAKEAKAVLSPSEYNQVMQKLEQGIPGYDPANYSGGKDCAFEVGSLVRFLSIDSQFPYAGTVAQYNYMTGAGADKWQRVKNSGNISDLKPGDVFSIGRSKGYGGNGHTFIYIGGGKIVASSMGDHGPELEDVYFHDDRNNQFGNSGNNIDIFRYVG